MCSNSFILLDNMKGNLYNVFAGYSLDIRVSYSILQATFTAYNGSREALNFP